jgi:choline dehydrogenase-like flavoprotein
VTVDAVIIGSGPGGATVADVLTAAGWDVVIVE